MLIIFAKGDRVKQSVIHNPHPVIIKQLGLAVKTIGKIFSFFRAGSKQIQAPAHQAIIAINVIIGQRL